ncbi:Gfo/Idh/MocA family protein [Paraburkholderia adhaesiva]|uniref:Gfo/Idh/MocA family protein n=1 Tax=Paraburkholderia adhaesiva TaxID=2883244 RepID=UPI001F2B34E6|nr:Gfo/Idh/MocA family oxidoreductase [Paraburkholderia adhaesiva]
MTRSTIRVGFIGAGRISDLHAIEYLQNPAARIVGICDRNVDAARAKLASWGIADVTVDEDVDRFLARADIDLVEILLPHHLHLPVALKAMAAGKIVSLQKPMCVDLAEADRLVEAVDTYERPFKVFENFIFYPPVLKARELVDQGAIGTPLSIRIKSNPARSATAWEVPASASAWRSEKAQAGGGPLVFDDGHHKFALAWHFMGDPEEVHAFIGDTEGPGGMRFDAQSIVSFRFPGNRIGNLEIVYSPDMELATRHYAQDDRVEITGTAGVLFINGGHGRLGATPPVTLYRDGQITTWDVPSGWEQSFVLSTRHFLNALQTGGAPVLTAREARQVLRFSSAAEQSAREGKAIRLAL